MCGQGTFRFFSCNMKAVHLYLSLSFLCQTVCHVIVCGFLLANISSWLGYITICCFSMKLTQDFFFFAFKCGWKSAWIKKKSTCVCVDVAQTWKKYLKLGGKSTLSLPSNFPPRSDHPMVREIAKNQQATSQTLQV